MNESVSEMYLSAVRAELRAEIAANLTDRTELAEAVGISRQSLVRYLSGDREIPLLVLMGILNFYDMDMPTFWERVEKRF